jgi:thioesterase domain-containing protein/acyl carrier protein
MLPPILSGRVRAPARASGDAGGALARRLREAPAAEREAIVLELVRGHVAAVLGHPSGEAVDPDRPFKDLGLDSLGAVELRNRLSQATGLRLPATLVFDRPTPGALAGYFAEQLADREPGAAPPPQGEGRVGALTELVRGAPDDDAREEIIGLIMRSSKFRPSFDSLDSLPEPPQAVTMATGSEPPALICVPSFVNALGPHQFMRFADTCDPRRPIAAISLVGFRPGDLLPSSWDLAIDALTASVREVAGDRPFVLVGYSIGGAIAHAIAERLAPSGPLPAGLVLIDTPGLGEPTAGNGGDPGARIAGKQVRGLLSVLDRLLAMDSRHALLDDDQLLTMGAYLRLLETWAPGPIDTPSLLVRAAEQLGDGVENEGWGLADDAVDVAADHFSLVDEQAPATARAVEEWIALLAPRDEGVGDPEVAERP